MITWLKKITMRIKDRSSDSYIGTVVPPLDAANPVDKAWASFLFDKDPSHLTALAHTASEAPQRIVCSEYFGPDILAFQNALISFHQGKDGDLTLLSQRLRKVSSTYRAQLAQLSLLSNPIMEYSISALVIGSDLNGLVVTDSLLTTCRKLLEADAAQKVSLLNTGCIPDPFTGQEEVRLHGTLLVDVPFIGFSSGQERAFFLSLQSPLDAIYFPSYQMVIRANDLRFSCVDRLGKLFIWMLRNLECYQGFWQQSSASSVRYLVRDKRPYHVLLDELSGRYELQEAGIVLPTLFFERASFIEGAETIEFTTPGRHVFADVLVSNHRRADKDEFSSRFFRYLKTQAEQLYGAPDIAESAVIIWISISGGEKRRWFEETDALKAFIHWARERFGSCHFYVDGWTSPQVQTALDGQQIAHHMQIWEHIRSAAQVRSDEYTSFIGTGVLYKIWGVAQAQFFISCAGTPSVWPSLIGRVPGVVHNSVSMIKRVQNTYYPDNVVRLPDEQVQDVNEIGQNIRWDKFSYSIRAEDVLQCADLAYAAAFGYKKPAQFYSALISARKSGHQQRVRALERLCKERLASYRNLPHLLNSSAFFGSPEVEILAEEENNYRLIDCSVGCKSDVIFVTFGKFSSHVDHVPFGHPFLGRSGFKHLHVAQARKTSYQKLSFDHFAELVKPLVEGYRYRFTYGPSLGGYAALYYASAIDAHAIAGSPRLPLHPENHQFKDVLWRPGSHWDEAVYEHLPFSSVVTADCPQPFIVYDPADAIDANFIRRCVAPHFSALRFLEVPGSKHGSLMQLSKGGKLKNLILDYVASIRGQ